VGEGRDWAAVAIYGGELGACMAILARTMFRLQWLFDDYPRDRGDEWRLELAGQTAVWEAVRHHVRETEPPPGEGWRRELMLRALDLACDVGRSWRSALAAGDLAAPDPHDERLEAALAAVDELRDRWGPPDEGSP